VITIKRIGVVGMTTQVLQVRGINSADLNFMILYALFAKTWSSMNHTGGNRYQKIVAGISDGAGTYPWKNRKMDPERFV